MEQTHRRSVAEHAVGWSQKRKEGVGLLVPDVRCIFLEFLDRQLLLIPCTVPQKPATVTEKSRNLAIWLVPLHLRARNMAMTLRVMTPPMHTPGPSNGEPRPLRGPLKQPVLRAQKQSRPLGEFIFAKHRTPVVVHLYPHLMSESSCPYQRNHTSCCWIAGNAMNDPISTISNGVLF